MIKPLPARTLKQRQAETGRKLALNGAAWRRLRASVLSEHPLCARCLKVGKFIPATDVDHIDNNPANNESSNLQSLCKTCHSRKTQGDRGHRGEVWGCDLNGMPLDPDHPWNDPDHPSNNP